MLKKPEPIINPITGEALLNGKWYDRDSREYREARERSEREWQAYCEMVEEEGRAG